MGNLEKIKAEIERRIINGQDGYGGNLKALLPFITSLQQEQPIKVYRVENEKEQKGLWRKFDGTWEPLFDMLTDGQCKDMPMEDSPIYREGGKQWFASAPSKDTLQKWFSKRDLEELTAKGFTISEFEVVGHKKISDFEYIFTRDSIINRTYLKVSDIYPKEQPEVDLEKACLNFGDEIGIPVCKNFRRIARHFYELGQQNRSKISNNSLKELRKEVIKFNQDHFEELHSDMDTIDIVHIVASHFFELGLNAARKEK